MNTFLAKLIRKILELLFAWRFVLENRKKAPALTMMLIASLGLVACSILLIFCQEDLSREVSSTLSVLAGILGACLKDSYGACREPESQTDNHEHSTNPPV